MMEVANRSDRLRAVLARFAQIEAGRANTPASDGARLDEVYLRRARQLAASSMTESQRATVPVLVCVLGQERFGLDLSELAEVFPYRNCAEVPGVPAAVLGVINVRGEIKAVVDLRRLLDMPSDEAGTSGYVVMLRRRDIGFRVDGVEGVHALDQTQMASDGERASVSGSRFVKALIANRIALLDTGAVCSTLGLGRT